MKILNSTNTGIGMPLAVYFCGYGVRGLRHRQKQIYQIALAVFASGVSWLFLGLSTPAQAVEKTWNICQQEVTKVEKRERIPAHLLSAISKVESGRWSKKEQVNIAWPWTVTAEGEGKFFKTKREAIKDIHTLMEMGITNIDVGCMQINLSFHGDNFESIEQSIEPDANVAYAAKYLKNMYREARNWTTAAGYYHSKTPKNSRRYKGKVVKFWNAIKRGETGTIQTATRHSARDSFSRRRLSRRGSLTFFKNKAQSGEYLQSVTLSRSRTRALSDKFRINREKRLAAESKDVRTSQLNDWRKFKGNGINSAIFAKARRAALEAQRKREYADMEKTGSAEYFEKRRKFQLSKWRSSSPKIEK